jgi:gas vesicle protein
MDYRADIARWRHTLVSELVAVAGELEAGRAATPFQDSLRRLAGDSGERPLVVAVLAIDTDAAAGFLAEITGCGSELATSLVATPFECLELSQHEPNWTIEYGPSSTSHHTAADFLAALNRCPRPDPSADPILPRLGLPGAPSGCCLLVPRQVGEIATSPALLSLLGDQTDWIFLVGTAQSNLSLKARLSVQTLLDQAAGVQHVLVRSSASPSALPVPEWWKSWKSQLALGVVRNGSELLRQRMDLLTSRTSELRLYLEERRRRARFHDLLQLIEEELEGLQRSLGNRAALLKEPAAGELPGTPARNAAEPWRARVAGESEALLKSIEAENRRRLGPDGDLARQIQTVTGKIAPGDILQTPGDEVVRLTLSPEAIARTTSTIGNVLRECLEEAYPKVNDSVTSWCRDAETLLQRISAGRAPLRTSLPDPEDLQKEMAAGRPEFQYRGEMPRATLLSRFQSARQGIMGLMILGTLGGGAAVLLGDGSGAAIRSSLTALMLPLLVLGFLWTYVSFRKRDRQLLEKELEKIRDGLGHELRRSLHDGLREQQTLLAQAVQKAIREMQSRVDQEIERAQLARQREAEEGRRRTADQLKTLEARMARLRSCQQQLGAIRSRSVNWGDLTREWINSWIVKFNQSAA